ncbi:MAG: GntR family transcriptional regulator [Opitutaceae bacterium]|jgi:DNA-binding GntR family transcriptional regulator|nr:GntR family transcriptional regulator [Opitutaceae bacterium]
MKSIPVVRTIREQIVNHLRTEILSGGYGEGSALREQHLAKRYGVSRGPIRDALLQLTKEGLLMAEPNRGVRVKKRASKETRALFVTLRKQIETHALRRIFPDITDADVTEWETHLEQYKTVCERADIPHVLERDMEFHRSILERVGDDSLIAVWLPLITRLLLPHHNPQAGSLEETGGDLQSLTALQAKKLLKRGMESYEEHCAIVTAIKKRQLKQAVAALEKNIQ